jgi:hypothetical protein
MGMVKTLRVEIRITEVDTRHILARVANARFGTSFTPEQVQVMYSGGHPDEAEFDGFAIVFEEVEKDDKPHKDAQWKIREEGEKE